MDFIPWLQENNINYSLKEIEGGWLFQIDNAIASNGTVMIKTPCNLGRTARTSLALFIITYDTFYFCKSNGDKPIFINGNDLEVKTIPSNGL